MRKRATARDVASLAGVSRTTVSFVLNDVPGMRISEETRQRVLEAAKQLDYHPDISAQRLVTGRTGIIAYVERQDPAQAFADAFLPQVLRGVHDAASASNYEVMFAPIPLWGGGNRCASLFRGRHVDGIILSGPRTDDDEVRELIETDAPIVLQGNWPEVSVASVDVDNVEAARTATEHLIRSGYHRLGMIAHAPLVYIAACERVKGYQQAVKAHDLVSAADRIALADFTPGSGEEAMETLLDGETPQAVFVSSDTAAIGAMRALKKRGLRVPEDVALVGFNDIPMAEYVDPPMTTVRLPAYGIGWGAADLAIRLIGEEEVRETHLLLDTELVVRESCGASRRPPGSC